MNLFEYAYAAALAIPPAGNVDGKTVTLPPQKVSCCMANIKYTNGGGNTLTITLQVKNAAGDRFDIPNNTIAITTSQSIELSMPGGSTAFILNFASTGAGDSVDVTLSSLPSGTIIA